MKYSNHILSSSFSLLVLTIINGIMFISAIDKHHDEGRRGRRNTTVNPSPRESVPNADKKLRRITVKSSKDHSRQLVRNKRTRGANDTRKLKQNRRELGKSSGKSSGKSNEGTSGGSNGSGGGSSGGSGGASSGGGYGGGGSGGGSGSGSGWSSDGYYCGCLCISSSDMNAGSYVDGVSCDFTVHENSYGSNNNRVSGNDNYQNDDGHNYQSYNWNNWKTVEGSGEDQYDYNNQYEGRNDEKDANGEQQNQDDVTVVVNKLDGTYNPYSAFDISQCDTYEHLWKYDLQISCADGDRFCECTYTEELVYMGLLLCSEVARCPDDCPICTSCMKNVCIGVPSRIVARGIESNPTMAAMAFLGTVLFAFCFVFVRRGKKTGDLDESLMDTTDSDTSASGNIWMVPVNEDGLPTEGSKTCRQVWLAPDIKATEHIHDSIFPDLLKVISEKKMNRKPKSYPGQDKASTKRNVNSKGKEKRAGIIPITNDTGNTTTKELRPTLWLAPVSDESVTSSISDSAASGSLESSEGSSSSNSSSSSSSSSSTTRSESVISDNRSIGTMEGEI